MIAYQAVGRALNALGVDTMFGVLGDGNLRLALSARENGVKYVGARHESSAVAMADAFARLTGKVGLATVTTGPGVTNALTALGESVKSHTPIVLLAGATASASEDYPQLIDQDGLVKVLGVGVQRVRTAEHLATDLITAFRRAAAERRPMIISVPTDLQDEIVSAEPALVAPVKARRPVPTDAVLEEIVALIQAARRPVILAGWGAVVAGAHDVLGDLGKATGAVLIASAAAKGFFAGESFSLGVSGGFGSEAAAVITGEADLVIAFGASLNRWTTRGGTMFPEAVVVQVDIDPVAFEHFVRGVVPVTGDVRETACELLRRIGGDAPTSDYAQTVGASRCEQARNGDPFTDRSTSETIDPRTLTVRLREVLPDHAVVVSDSGAYMGFPGSYFEPKAHTGYLFSQSFQTMGLGVAHGVGIAVARPEAIPVVLIGDGGLLMSLGELETAVRIDHPFVVVVYNDSAYGAEVHIGGQHGFATDIVRFPTTDFAATARGIGGEGHVVRSSADLDVLDRWLQQPHGLLLLDARTDATIAAPFIAELARSVADAPRAAEPRSLARCSHQSHPEERQSRRSPQQERIEGD